MRDDSICFPLARACLRPDNRCDELCPLYQDAERAYEANEDLYARQAEEAASEATP